MRKEIYFGWLPLSNKKLLEFISYNKFLKIYPYVSYFIECNMCLINKLPNEKSPQLSEFVTTCLANYLSITC
jgi:hypothetical protein